MVGLGVIYEYTIHALTQSTQFMHNGSIADFGRFKRSLQSLLPDEIYNVPQGNTGTVTFFVSDIRLTFSNPLR